MAKKITQYPASLGNPDANSLIDISEYASNAYVTKKLTITQLLAYLNTNLQFTPAFTFKNVSGATIFKGTPCEISNVSSGTTSVIKIASSNTATGQIFIPNADVLNNANGVFITNGLLTPFDTTPYAIGTKLYWNVTTSTITSVAQDDMIFIGIVLNVSATGSIFVAPSLNPSKVKGAVGQIALFSDDRNVKSVNRFSYIDNVGTEVGFRFSDTNNNLTKIGVTLIDVQTQGLYDSKISLNQYGTNANKSKVELNKARGTLAAPTRVLANDVLGEIDFGGGLDSLVNTANPVTSIVNTAQIIVKALTNFQKDYDTFNNDTTANAKTELAIWLQGSNQLVGGNSMPTNSKVFWVDGDGKINFKYYNFPITAGTNGQSLVTDASGNITWQTISPSISLASEQVAFGNASNLISSTSNFKFYLSNISNPTNQRSAIFLVSTENDYTGQTYYGALRIKQQSSECLNVFDQINAITNLSKGSIIRLGTYDSSLGSGIYLSNNQSIGEIDFGVNDGLIGAKIKAFAEQIVNGGNFGTRLEFHVTPLNSITPALALKIDNTGKVYFKNYNFPLADGTNNQALVTDGSGNITFQTLFNTPTIANSVPYYDALTTKFLSTKLYWDNAASSFKWDNEINTMFNNKLHMAFYNTGTTGFQDSIYHGINFQAYNDSSFDGATIRVGHMRGVIGASQHLQNFDVIGKIHFNASDNVDGYTAAMWGRATENHTLTSKGSSITFETTPNNSITPQINLVIGNDGQIYFKNYRFPVADGTSNQLLATNGLGVLSFVNNLAPITQDKWALPNSAQLRGQLYNPLVTTKISFGSDLGSETGTKTAKTPNATNELSKKISCKLAVSVSSANGNCSLRGTNLNYFRENGILFSSGFAISDTGYNPSSTMFVGLSYLTIVATSYTAPATIGNALWNSLSFVGVGNDGYSASFTGSCTGTTLIVSAITYGTLEVGQSFSTAVAGTKIVSQISGTTGGVGSYTISVSQTITNSTMRAFDLNLCIMHNDASGNATKIPLGDNFPANRLAAGVNTNNFYVFEMYSGIDAYDVSWRIRNTGIANSVTEGTISTNLPALGIPMNYHIYRNSMGDSNACSFDISHLYCSNLS
mgnify:CR=1 FL=1